MMSSAVNEKQRAAPAIVPRLFQRDGASIVPSDDGTFAWLFFSNPMPGASTVTVHVVGNSILAADGGQPLDADGDGNEGGTQTYQFSTVSLVRLANTSLIGRVFDPGPDLKPMTFDDMRAGPDGALRTSDDVFLYPIAGVKVFIIGLEQFAVYTDAQGRFTLPATPSGNVKLAIDGRTATNAPGGFYFPEMVMDLELEVGQLNTVMGTMGTREQREANRERDEVYLPRLQTSILQTVSNTAPTLVGVDAESAPNLTPEQRQHLQLEVQPGSLIGADGQPLINPQVGISTVPPELVREMLPAGLLQHTFDITIQAPDAAVFSTPLQISFPNVFNAAPGTKLNFLSFDHTTGRLVIEGTATVSADGDSVVTDPGTGITKPGWHGVTPPGKVGKTPYRGPIGRPGPPGPIERFFRRLDPYRHQWQRGGGNNSVRGSEIIDPEYRFDFGTATSTVAPGYLLITPSDLYSDQVGYGWEVYPGHTLGAIDHSGELVAGINANANTTTLASFLVDVPDGVYALTVTLGDAATPKEGMGVFHHGVFMNSVSTNPGQFVKNLYLVTVDSGQLEVTFGAFVPGQSAAVTAMEFKRISDLPDEQGSMHQVAQTGIESGLFYYAYLDIDTGFTIRGKAHSS
jgi:hypothetical protein